MPIRGGSVGPGLRGEPALQESTPPYPVQRSGLVVAPLRGRRWRVTRGDGGVLGYIAEIGGDFPFEASRMRLPSTQRLRVGAFASAEDALDAIRAA